MKVPYPKLITYALILLISFIIALVANNESGSYLNGFYSYVLVGIWIICTSEFVIRIKRNRDYLADQNQMILIFGSLFLGNFYGWWGDLTPIFTNSLLPGITWVSLNVWQTIFAAPYLFIGTIFLILCLKKYFYIYLGKKSVSSQGTAIVLSIFFFVSNLVYLLIQQEIIAWSPANFYFRESALNLLVLLELIISLIIGIIGILNRPTAVSGYSLDRVSNRLNEIDQQIASADRVANQARDREDAARRRELERQRRNQLEQQRRRKAQRRQEEIKRSTSKPSPSHKSKSQKSRKSLDKKTLLRMKPKTGILTEDDFKCIFCFELPNSSDSKKGIVLCPNCNYPAHVDEFKEWVKTSSLCSRCDGEIPASFRRNPRVISTSTYLKAYKYWKKKF